MRPPRPPLAGALHLATRTDLLESLRAYLEAKHGLRTWYLLRPPAPPYVFDSALVDAADGEAAFYDPAALVVHVGPEATRALDAFRDGYRSPSALGGVRTALHELWHAASPMLQEAPTDYEDHAVGRLVEEGVAEHRARRAVACDLLGLAGYRPLMDDPRWAPFFRSRTLEANGMAALAVVCGEAALDAAWVRPDARGRAEVLNAALAPVVSGRLAWLGAGRTLVASVGPALAAHGYRLLLDKAARQPFAARRPDDVPLAAFLRAANLLDALAVLHAPGMIPESLSPVRGPR